MSLITKSRLLERAQKASGYFTEGNIRSDASRSLILAKAASDASGGIFDIFLSHSSEDAILVRGLRDELTDAGLRVYVDWIDDPQLDRTNVTSATAATLRMRMDSCRCLLYATSKNARGSVWMPWELGYMDAKTDARVGIVPIVEEYQAYDEFAGVEYLGLYPYLDKTGTTFWIHKSRNVYVQFSKWMAGTNP